MKSIFALIAFCCLAPQVVAQAATSQAKASWQIEKVDYFTEPTSTAGVERKKAAVRFTNRQRIELPLDNTVVIAVLRGSDQSEFLLAQGTNCTECDESVTVRLYQLTQSGLVANDHSYYNAGSELDFYEPQTKVQESRVFYGQCLAAATSDVVVWFTKFIGEDDKWHDFNTIATLANDGVKLEELDAKKVNLAAVLTRVANAECHEISGSEWFSEP